MNTASYLREVRVDITWKFSREQLALATNQYLPESERDKKKSENREMELYTMGLTFFVYGDEDVAKPSLRLSEIMKIAMMKDCIRFGNIIPVEEWGKVMKNVIVASFHGEYVSRDIAEEMAKQRFVAEVLSGGEWMFTLRK